MNSVVSFFKRSYPTPYHLLLAHLNPSSTLFHLAHCCNLLHRSVSSIAYYCGPVRIPGERYVRLHPASAQNLQSFQSYPETRVHAWSTPSHIFLKHKKLTSILGPLHLLSWLFSPRPWGKKMVAASKGRVAKNLCISFPLSSFLDWRTLHFCNTLHPQPGNC